jgi:GntR family transcriptional regulator
MLNSLDPQAIRKDIPVPLHYQLSELLNQQIEAGRWRVGEKIPTEEELCALFGLSRTTVRKALDTLVNAGYLTRQKSRGTFVAEKLVEGLVNRPAGFYDDMTRQGIRVVSTVLEKRVIQPPDKIARELQLNPNQTVIALDRLRFIRDEPIMLVSCYLPYDLCPSLLEEDLTDGLYQLLREKYGFKIVRAKRFLEAVAANDYEAQMLQVKPGAPLMLIESTSYLEDGRPFEYFKARHRGDRTRFIIENYMYGTGERVNGDAMGVLLATPPR